MQVDVAGLVRRAGEAQRTGPVDVELDQQIAAGRDGIGATVAALVGEGDRPGVGEEQFRLAGLGVARAQVQVERPGVGLAGAGDAADLVDERLGVDVELERAARRRGDVRQVGAVAADDDALQLVRLGLGGVVVRVVEAGVLRGQRDRRRACQHCGGGRAGSVDGEAAHQALFTVVAGLNATRLGEG